MVWESGAEGRAEEWEEWLRATAIRRGGARAKPTAVPDPAAIRAGGRRKTRFSGLPLSLSLPVLALLAACGLLFSFFLCVGPAIFESHSSKHPSISLCHRHNPLPRHRRRQCWSAGKGRRPLTRRRGALVGVEGCAKEERTRRLGMRCVPARRTPRLKPVRLASNSRNTHIVINIVPRQADGPQLLSLAVFSFLFCRTVVRRRVVVLMLWSPAAVGSFVDSGCIMTECLSFLW